LKSGIDGHHPPDPPGRRTPARQIPRNTVAEESVYRRYFSQLKLDRAHYAHERLTRICFNDYDREIALVAEFNDKKAKQKEILGVGRLSKEHGLNEGEFALLISDRSQKQGLGTELLKRLVQIGRDEKLARITAIILADNHAMQRLSQNVGFKVGLDEEGHDYVAEIAL
jgi:acetyltransferase